MDTIRVTQTYVVSTVAVLVALASFAHAYVGPSCRTCLITGDWPACAQCFSSKPGIVPFYGMAKRSGGDYGFLPGSSYGNYRGDSAYSVHKRGLPINNVGFLPGGGLYDDYRGDSLYGSMYRRSGGADTRMGEMRKRSDYLASYCCLGLEDDDCCDVISDPSEDWEDEGAYELYEEDSCLVCLHKDTFDYEYCLQCVKKKK